MLKAPIRTILACADKILAARLDASGISGKLRLIAVLALLSYLFNWSGLFHRIYAQYVSTSPHVVSSWLPKKIEAPFSPLDLSEDATGHMEKRAYRFVPFLIAHLLRLDHRGLVRLQSYLGVVFPLLIWTALFNETESMTLATGGTLVVNALYCGVSFFYDDVFFDSYAYFFLALAMLFRNSLLTVLFLLGAAFTDERALLASSLVFIWQIWCVGDLTPRRLRNHTAWFIGFILLYAFLRAGIGYLTGLKTGWRGIGIDVLQGNLPNLILLAWSVFEGGWLIIGYAAFLAMDTGESSRRYLLALTALCFLALFVGGLMVGDSIRGQQYAFPLLLTAIAVVGKRMKSLPNAIQKPSILLSLLTPITIYLGHMPLGDRTVFNMWMLKPGYVDLTLRAFAWVEYWFFHL